ncbi:MAG: FAD-binding oxidoreductase [Allosphingosinicella sp.]
MVRPASPALLDSLAALLGPRGFSRDAGVLEPWLSDWRGRYRGRAAALLSPASTEEVKAIVARCAGEGVALVPQGGNTSMVGGATPDSGGGALLLSLRRMNRIRSLSPEENVALVEAGTILADLHDAAAAAGRRFPLSLGAKGSATVGGLVSTNAGGTQVLRFGPMRSLVLGLEAVLPDGSLLEGLSALRKDNRGYDLKQLLIGAEGTLGVVTAASLRLVAAAGSRSVAWVGLASPAAALTLLRRLEARLGEAVESFELVPQDALALVLAAIAGTRAPLAGAHRWHVLVEAVAPEGARDSAGSLEDALAAALEEGLAEDAVVAASEAQAAALWKLRESTAEAERTQGPSVKHDVSVPVSAMPAFIEQARTEVERRFEGARVVAFGHLGDGNVHFNVQPPAGAAAEAWLAAQAGAVTRLVHDLVGEAGGSISAEHGIGQMKVDELVRTADPARLSALRAIKAALDPLGIMNPGKLIAASPAPAAAGGASSSGAA